MPTIHDAFCFSQSFIIINTITNKWKKKSPSSTKRTLHLISDNYTLIINRMFRFGWKPHSTHKQVIWLQSMLFTVTSSFRTFTWFPLNMCLHLYPNTFLQPCQAKKQIGDGAFLKMPRPQFDRFESYRILWYDCMRCFRISGTQSAEKSGVSWASKYLLTLSSCYKL